jgi:hypothetical protein
MQRKHAITAVPRERKNKFKQLGLSRFGASKNRAQKNSFQFDMCISFKKSYKLVTSFTIYDLIVDFSMATRPKGHQLEA